MKIVTTRQIQEIDHLSIEKIKVPGTRLMENAGRALFCLCRSMLKDIRNPKVIIACGRGNNGGDGFALGSMLLKSRIKTQVLLACSGKEVRGDAAVWYKKYLKAKGRTIKADTKDEIAGLDKEWFGRYDIVVDAILGTGIKGAPREPINMLIQKINRSCRPVICVDTPSGMNNDTGETPGDCIRGNFTVTFGFPKLGQFFFPGKAMVGRLIIADIEYPEEAENSQNAVAELADDSFFRTNMVLPPPTAHKNQCGKVLLIAGSTGYTGAASLAAMAALRSGAGVVKLAVPEPCNNVLEIKLTEPITIPLPYTGEGTLALAAKDKILELARWADSVILGPGIGLNAETSELVRQLLQEIKTPMILDADGITAFKDHREILYQRKFPLVITPHLGEFARISDLRPSDVPLDRIKKLQDWINDKSFTLLLKGTPTLTFSAGATCILSATGNQGMATAGSGDVLAGIIGAFLAKGITAHISTALGAFIHGLAGDIAAERLGVLSTTAGDILREIPQAFCRLYKA